MKIDGVPYEERMEALEEIHWHVPPCETQIRAMFNIHHERKPYLNPELLQPKHITRLLLETASSLNEFVRDFGLKRSEGLVVRYVSQTLKYLKQTIPQTLRSQDLEGHLSTLETLVSQVDSTFIDTGQDEMESRQETKVVKLSTLAARKQLRTVLQQGLRAWQARRFDGFGERFVNEAGETMTGEMVERLTVCFEQSFGSFRLTQGMVDNHALTIRESGPQTWLYRQHLGIDEADEDWYLSGKATFVVTANIGTLAITLEQCQPSSDLS
jgi:hypothetical protein